MKRPKAATIALLCALAPPLAPLGRSTAALDRERQHYAGLLDTSLRAGMPRRKAERALAAQGINVNYYNATTRAQGLDMDYGYSFLGDDRFVLLPYPGPRRLEVRLYFEGDRLARWEAATTNTLV